MKIKKVITTDFYGYTTETDLLGSNELSVLFEGAFTVHLKDGVLTIIQSLPVHDIPDKMLKQLAKNRFGRLSVEL